MIAIDTARLKQVAAHVAQNFKTRDFIFHDGRALRRFSIAGRTQAALAGVATLSLCFTAYGVAHAGAAAASIVGLTPQAAPESAEAKLARLQTKVAAMQAQVATIKQAAQIQAQRVEERQALIAAVLAGDGSAKLALNAPALDAHAARVAGDVVAPLTKVEAHQRQLAAKARELAERRYALATAHFRKLGLSPERFVRGGQGGPYEPVATTGTTDANADAQFRSLFLTWKKLETLEKAVIAIPASQPVPKVNFSSYYGVRSDPFRGTAAMHAGVDIPGSVGTPIYATADGIVSRAERSGGYGNLIEVNHGRGIATRYGHLSKIIVAPNTRVTRGQLIGLMGSTGRSTGSHLHYEVRIDGQAVNPMPFLQTVDYLKGRTPVEHPLVEGGTDAAN
ncbi:MAG: M23 family metallopeptidase [Sphingomonas sp.]|uniref:M23 family metallopeptidase n=1 Tax=Sphingomonas sp. TaxID=28214 RepID=UPI0025D74295|nr:M23 family metallopeptidase [Sphingomonas sp.]MBX9881785.1 M23 family metallopeptidase [Sphingomonas sp.]